MKSYVVYFADNEAFLKSGRYEFEYTVEASNEEEAKRRAVTKFNTENPELNLDDYTYGFARK